MTTSDNAAGRIARDRSGNVAVSAALGMTLLATVVGGAIEVHHAEEVRSNLRDALDGATLAAAGDNDDVWAKASMRTQVGGRPDISTWTASFTFPEPGHAVGDASATLDTVFLGLIGMRRLTVRAQAEAVAGSAAPPCITLLDKTASQALLVNSGAKIIAPQCEIHVHSTAAPAAIFNSGTELDVSRICVAGTNIIANGGRPDPLETGCEAKADPFAATLPTPPPTGCTVPGGTRDKGPLLFQPGVYCGGLNFNGAIDVTFAPGLYVIQGGDWNVNGGSWTGSGVTFYFADSSRIQFNSGVRAKLAAPTSGPYRNFLIFEKPGLSRSAFIFNDSASNELDGIIYLPSRNMTYNSGSEARGDRLAMVFNTLIVNQTNWRLAPPEGAKSKSTPRLLR